MPQSKYLQVKYSFLHAWDFLFVDALQFQLNSAMAGLTLQTDPYTQIIICHLAVNVTSNIEIIHFNVVHVQ